ncbi:MAG: PQQ-dependent sugar dehydrogenase [Planctomycetota bacterium]|jgi:glucose/arabinose dehydrogenase
MLPRSLFAIATVVLPLAGLMTATAVGAEPLTTVRLASGLQRPVLAAHAPGDNTRLFIVEQRGIIRILDLTTNTMNATSFLNIDALVAGPTSQNDERGLLGLAFHPNYQVNGFFYVNYTRNSDAQGEEDTVIARYTRLTPDQADSGSASIVMIIDQPQSNHNGGWHGFSPIDGYLYIGTGDGGNFCDTGAGHTTNVGNGQDLSDNLLGKMLRIDVDGDDFPADPNANYANPPDNPYVGTARDDEIWAYGLRNPWRCSFDRANGDLYMADVGQGVWEEIDYQEATSTGTENYGWRCFEGNSCSTVSGCASSPCNCNSSPTMVFPIHQYAHGSPSFGCSVSGGYVYRGCAIPSLEGTYFFADFCSNKITSFKVVAGSATELTDRTAELAPGGGLTINAISGFGEDALGEIYIVDRGSSSANGELYKIIPVTKLADFDCDGQVGVTDFLILLANWGPCAVPTACPWDLNGDGTVNVNDFLILLAQWGPVS